MKSTLNFSGFILLLGIVMFLSCKKELSCENCNENNKPPIAIAGPDQIIVLPADSVSLDGSASYDTDGTIVSYKWTKISGPVSANIIKPDSSKTLVKALLMGVYKFELLVKDNVGLLAKDTLMVVVNDPAINQPPIANAGTDQTITLPVDSVILNGNLSFDPDGTITSYQWTKITGPATFNIFNPASVQTKVDQLLQGIYFFELKVTDNGGLTGRDTVGINVLPAVLPSNCDISNRPVGNARFTTSISIPVPRYGLMVATVGNKILIAGGFTSYVNGQPANFTSRVDIYDVGSGQWSLKQLSEPRQVGAFAVLGNKVFFAGGGNVNGLRTTVDIYDVTTNSWSVAQLSQAREGISGGVINNKVFFAGGTIWVPIGGGQSTQQLLDRVDIYDAGSNAWSTASLSEGRYNNHELEKITCTVVGSNIFFSGGSCNTVLDCTSNRIDIYNTIANTWTNEYYLGLNGGVLFSGIAEGNKNYRVMGDYWQGGSSVEIRDEITHITTSECLSGYLYSTPMKNGNKLIFPVSQFPNYTGYYKLTQFDVFELSTGTWSINKLPPNGFYFPSSFNYVNNEIYAVDGNNTGGGFLFDKILKLEF